MKNDFDRQQLLSYQMPDSFTILRTTDVQFDQAYINIQIWSYPFVWDHVTEFNYSYLFDHSNSIDTGKADTGDKYNESRSVGQVVDMTTLAGASKSVSFFNSPIFVISSSGSARFQIVSQTLFGSTVEFNVN